MKQIVQFKTGDSLKHKIENSFFATRGVWDSITAENMQSQIDDTVESCKQDNQTLTL
jgi:hypothetical protein